MFALEGHCCNRCYVVPSLDLVVARIGSGPVRWDEQAFIGAVVSAPHRTHARTHAPWGRGDYLAPNTRMHSRDMGDAPALCEDLGGVPNRSAPDRIIFPEYNHAPREAR